MCPTGSCVSPWTKHNSSCKLIALFKPGLFDILENQDIKAGNILVNHYSADFAAKDSQSRKKWRRDNLSNNQVRYCLIDFDLSVILPKDVKRLPCSYAYCAPPFSHPRDIDAGEYDYDPYAFDVACLGYCFVPRFDVSDDPRYTLWLCCLTNGAESSTEDPTSRTILR